MEFSSTYNVATKTYAFTLFNIYTQPVIATKQYIGGPKPPVSFQLYRQIGSDPAELIDDPVILDGVIDDNETAAWTYQWPHQRVSSSTGQLYTYYVDEADIPPYYAKTISEDGLTVTNTYLLSSIAVSKIVAGNFGDRDKNLTFATMITSQHEFPTPSQGSGYTLSCV